MLAPMQGLTNRGLRAVFCDWVHPDVVFTEHVQLRPKSQKPLSKTTLREACTMAGDTPLVVQLIGAATSKLVDAAATLDQLGVRHINLNMGCPFGRMVSRLAGGNIFKDLSPVPDLLKALRRVVRGSFSVKARCGYENPRQIFDLVSAFEAAEVDFLVLHPRTVVQKYEGLADQEITRELVRATQIPVIANGDIVSVASARRVREQTGAAGLMLGRGALADPLLFERIRGHASEAPTVAERTAEMSYYLGRLADRYHGIFSGDAQVLEKLKSTLATIEEPEMKRWVRRLRRTRNLQAFLSILEAAPG